MKAVPPHYLGTLKVLEDKHLQKNSTEFDKADSLRAAVFQVDFKNTKKKKKKHMKVWLEDPAALTFVKSML